MFNITDNEKLRDAYALLMFMQNDIPASAEKKSAVKNLAATVKREIRAYNNRPASNVRIISGDYNGHLDLVRLPDELDRMHEEAAADWFRGNCYLNTTIAPMTAQGRSLRAGISCSGGRVTGLHTTRCAGTYERRHGDGKIHN